MGAGKRANTVAGRERASERAAPLLLVLLVLQQRKVLQEVLIAHLKVSEETSQGQEDRRTGGREDGRTAGRKDRSSSSGEFLICCSDPERRADPDHMDHDLTWTRGCRK